MNAPVVQSLLPLSAAGNDLKLQTMMASVIRHETKNTEFKRAGYIDLDHLVNQRKVRVINDISEIESDVLLTLTQDVRITYTTNIVEAFRETKFKKGNQNV